jgi:hypothetical protein
MAELTLQRVETQTYDVFFTVAGGPRFVWRIPNHGVTVSDSGIVFAVNDSPRTADFSTIAAIHLSTGALGNASNVIDQCRIEFNGGAAITVSNAAANGLPAAAQTRIYRDFVRDLHGRLVTSTNHAISYTAGMSSGRYKFGLATMVVAGLFFVVTPLVLAVVTGDPHALIPMGMGVLLVWPFMRLISNNTPRNYTPDSLPDELMS